MPTLPSVLAAYRARVAQAAQDGLEYRTLRDGFLPSLQKAEPPDQVTAPHPEEEQNLPQTKKARKKASVPSMRRGNRAGAKAQLGTEAKFPDVGVSTKAEPGAPQTRYDIRHPLPDIHRTAPPAG